MLRVHNAEKTGSLTGMTETESPRATQAPLIVFTDLDGTLLDHHSYSWRAASPALARLRKAGVPVILASSKTATEIALLRDQLGFGDCPAIVENGAGLLPAGAAPEVDLTQYRALRQALDQISPDLRQQFQGFGDWGTAGIADHTGLSLADAEKAGQRAFSEPGLWSGDAAGQARFIAALTKAGITARSGGRFLTLSFGGSKAEQMNNVLKLYTSPRSVALGDAPNDIEMLMRADIGIIVANPDHPPLAPLAGESGGRIRRTTLPGPAGWNDAMMAVMDEFGI